MRIFLFLFLAAPSLSAQSFFPLPGPLLEQELAFDQANECYIYFDNLGGDSLRLRWKTIAESYPEAWTVDLCDFGLCYVGIPASGLMNPAVGAEQPYLKLIVQPGMQPGAAWIGFRVWQDGAPANYADVFFGLHTPGVSAAQEPGPQNVRVFPNPTSGTMFLENTGWLSISVRLVDAAGKLVWSGGAAPGERQVLDLSAWPVGAYFLQTNGGTQIVQRVH